MHLLEREADREESLGGVSRQRASQAFGSHRVDLRIIGFERTLAYVTGLANVRDAIPFPRTPGHAAY